MLLFVSHFSPDSFLIFYLEGQLKLFATTCNRLRTKFKTYASYHFLVSEEDSPLINRTEVWLNGCLIAPFFGHLNHDKIYISDTPTFSPALQKPDDPSLPINLNGATGGSSDAN
jgi:hypothetical protein